MLARQPFLRRFVVYNKEPSPSYMTGMVSSVWKLKKLPFHSELLLGEELAPSVAHLMPSVEVSQIVQDTCIDASADIHQILRGAYMILNTRLHTMGVTSSSMTLEALNLVQLRNWSLFGNSLRSSLLQLKWRISYMQYGIIALLMTITRWQLFSQVLHTHGQPSSSPICRTWVLQ